MASIEEGKRRIARYEFPQRSLGWIQWASWTRLSEEASSQVPEKTFGKTYLSLEPEKVGDRLVRMMMASGIANFFPFFLSFFFFHFTPIVKKKAFFENEKKKGREFGGVPLDSTIAKGLPFERFLRVAQKDPGEMSRRQTGQASKERKKGSSSRTGGGGAHFGAPCHCCHGFFLSLGPPSMLGRCSLSGLGRVILNPRFGLYVCNTYIYIYICRDSAGTVALFC